MNHLLVFLGIGAVTLLGAGCQPESDDSADTADEPAEMGDALRKIANDADTPNE